MSADAESAESVLCVEVHVTGSPSDHDDAGAPGVYGHEVTFSRPVKPMELSPAEKGAIAAAVLDEFHDRQGIEVLDDFEISVHIANGPEIAELDDSGLHATDFVQSVEHTGKASAS